MENFYKNDKSGNKKKFDYMFKHHPIITNNILSWAKDNELYGLPFDELSYLKFNNLTSVPMDDNGYKTFKGWSKGYSVRGKHSNLYGKFIDNNIINFIDKLSDKDLLAQRKCGKISQIILNNYIFVNEINEIIKEDIPIRFKINMLLQGEYEVPKCEICGKKTKHRLTHGEFRKTCSEKCRRELEGSFKSYKITYNNEEMLVQGYERFVVPNLLKKYCRSDLKIGFENEFIEYDFKGETKKYLPDVFIKSENKIIEVKSTYTYKLDLEKNLAKRDGCILKGFNFEFQIWDNGKIKIIK